MNLSGVKGHLLSTSFLARKLAGVNATKPFSVPRRSALGPASSLRTLLDAGLTPLLEATHLSAPVAVDATSAMLLGSVLTHAEPVAIMVVPWAAPLHLYWRAAVEQATRRSARCCLMFNGIALRLVDSSRPHASRFTEFDLQSLDDEPSSATALQLMLGSLESSFDALIRESEDFGVAVCRSLRDGVLSASSEVLAALVHRKRHASLDSALEQSLTIVYRLLFLLFAESRGLMPLWHPLYRRSYSIEALVAASARGGDARGLWDALRAIARLAHSGCKAGDLRVTPFNGRLFSPARTPLAERRDLDDERARRALISVATRTPAAGAARERIAYRDLGVEQLGSVYESLLDYRPCADPVGLVPGSGVRKSTGTFYTPQPIAEYLVRTTLAPLVKDADPQQILSLRVLDPAMGSGAFLVAACQYLAQAYESALIESGACSAGDVTERVRVSIRRTIAERCLYGVDINPMAVQLARLSLWLTTLAADRPLTFLDHRLRSGDSLLGAWVENLRRPPCRSRDSNRKQPGPPRLFDEADIAPALSGALPVRFSLELTPDDTLDQVREKERALQALDRDDSALSRWKRIADTWCAAWLDPGRDGVPAAAFGALSDHVLTGQGALPRRTASTYLDRVAAVSAARRPFHWELEFPEVFFDASGHRLPRAGFDAVVGNPPWEVVRGDEPGRTFHRASGIFSSSVTGHGNLYQLFTERALTLLRGDGRLGLVLPSGLATDHNAAPLRRRLMRDAGIDTLAGFDNHRGVFAIHRSVKFLLITATKGTPTTSIAVRLGQSDLTSLDTHSSPLRLTPALLQRISGDTMAIPELRSADDVAIVERAATLFPPLGSPDGWSAAFGRELNATDDAKHFGSAGLPVIEGKHIEPFRTHAGAAGRFISATRARTLLPSLPFEHRRLAYRDVASATNKLTLIAAILPAGCVSTHTLFCLRSRLSLRDQHYLCGLFNSLVVNYLVRMRVTTHVTTATVERLPVPPPGFSPSAEREIAALARLLARRFHLESWAQLQRRVAELYQLSKAEFEHVLGTFPLIAANHREVAYDTYEPQRH